MRPVYNRFAFPLSFPPIGIRLIKALKFSVSTSFWAAGKCQVRWLGRRRRRKGRKEWRKSHTKATERLCLAEGCDFKTERGEEWNAKVGEQWSAVFPPVRPEEPTSTSASSPPWLVHSWSVCWGGASQHYSRPVEFPGGGRAAPGQALT